jgi:hypothetical protein
MTAPEPGSARWAELVRKGIALDANRNWFLGDAALEIAPMGRGHAANSSGARLAQYADEVGVGVDSLRVYRDVAAAWPVPIRLGTVAWSVHQVLMARQDLIRPGMSVSVARAAAGVSNLGRTGPGSPAADRANAVRAYLADPEVADAVMAEPRIRAAAIAAISRATERDHLDQPRPVTQPRGVADDADDIDLAMILLRRVNGILTEAAVVLHRSVIAHSAEMRDGFLAVTGGARNRLDVIDSIVSGRSADDELADIPREDS